MRTSRPLDTKMPLIVYACELDACPRCGGPLVSAYVSGRKTVQTLTEVLTIAQQPKHCADPTCARYPVTWKSARWRQIAPPYCTYGYDVIAHIGWQRQTYGQTFEAIHASLPTNLYISESEVRALYHATYLPLLACQERQHLDTLTQVAEQSGLLLSLDGLAPEGGEPQLWVVRELQTGLTLRSGWLSRQDQPTFVNFLQPIANLGLPVVAVLSDKQRGLEPAVAAVFPQAKHAFCQLHYLQNAAAPVADADETMKVALRKTVRAAVGELIRQEHVENPGVLTVTGLVPSPVDKAPLTAEPSSPVRPTLPEPSAQVMSPATPAQPADPVAQEREAIVQDLLRRVRYLLTLKGRPPFRLAGLEMFERLSEVATCLDSLIQHHAAARLVQMRDGLRQGLQAVQSDYTDLRQAADWLEQIAALLDPDGQPVRSGAEVRRELFTLLDIFKPDHQASSQLHEWYVEIYRVSESYAPGLFHCYDVPGLPRTNNERESEFRDLTHRLLATTGQQGLVRRLIQREGAWEVIPRPGSLPETIQVLSQVDPDDFRQERQRVRQHRNRFRLHTRSAKQSRAQLKDLEQRWTALPPPDSS